MVSVNEHAALVTIIMINRNGGELLRRALRSCCTSLERAWAQRQDFELIVVDNGSTDDSPKIIQDVLSTASFPNRIVEEPTPGVNFARNAGLRAARGQYLIFTDSDLEFSEDWLAGYLEAFAEYPQCRVFAGRVLLGGFERPAPKWLATSGLFCRPAVLGVCDTGEDAAVYRLAQSQAAGPVGANMGFHRSVFDEFGPFDMRFGLRPGSLVPGAEAEYFDRLARAGLTFAYVPKALVWHPLPKKKMTKSYFLKRLFGNGRVTARIRRIRGMPCKRLCGVTLYEFEYLLKALAKYVLALPRADAQERFFLLGDVAIHLGYIYEDCAHYRAGDTPSEHHIVPRHGEAQPSA